MYLQGPLIHLNTRGPKETEILLHMVFSAPIKVDRKNVYMYVPAVGGCHRVALCNLENRDEQFMPNSYKLTKEYNGISV